MMRIMDEQQQQIEAAARSASAKLRAFHDGLTPDEREALGLAAREIGAGMSQPAEDVAGHMVTGGVPALPGFAELQHLLASAFGIGPSGPPVLTESPPPSPIPRFPPRGPVRLN
jgi:hypothetical protein